MPHRAPSQRGAHPVLLDEPLAADAGQVAVLPGQLRLALLQRRHQPAALHLHLQVQQVEGGVRLYVLVKEKGCSCEL